MAPPPPATPPAIRQNIQTLTNKKPATFEPPSEVPPPTKVSSGATFAVITLVILAIAGFSVWFFVFHKPEVVVTEKPNPSGTIVVSTTPIPAIETIFPVVDSITIDSGSDVFVRFKDIVGGQIENIGKIGLYRVYKPQKANGDEYKFSEFMTGGGVQVPTAVMSMIDDNMFYVTIMRLSNNGVGYGLIVKASNVNNLRAAMTIWESTLSESLKNLFTFDINKAASPGFLDNTYQGTPIRYRNFPNPSMTIDYSIITAANGESYLLISNSREHIYTIVDKLKAIAPVSSSAPETGK